MNKRSLLLAILGASALLAGCSSSSEPAGADPAAAKEGFSRPMTADEKAKAGGGAAPGNPNAPAATTGG